MRTGWGVGFGRRPFFTEQCSQAHVREQSGNRDRKTGAVRALLAHNDGSGLNYAGAAFIALAGDERTQFFAELERQATAWAAFKSSRLVDVKWCQPAFTVRVKHLAGSKTLRHATVRALTQG